MQLIFFDSPSEHFISDQLFGRFLVECALKVKGGKENTTYFH